ncbi:hypothetical protein E2C01_074201 [Portunus trituberculatus]|uniref:Uncharacterized protein n=1 Tax=Portunus trituberculatus TaxID=210409 RepID=A0A5B7IBJ8_PORTR|nr:hypothetical protein [Portunus trituberculatus]
MPFVAPHHGEGKTLLLARRIALQVSGSNLSWYYQCKFTVNTMCIGVRTNSLPIFFFRLSRQQQDPRASTSQLCARMPY